MSVSDEPLTVQPLASQPSLPPARTAPGVSTAVASSFVTTFAMTIQYVGPWNWPLAAPTDAQALAVAGFILTTGATLYHLLANWQYSRTLAAAGP